MNNNLNIFFIGLGSPIPTFIIRRIKALHLVGITCLTLYDYKYTPNLPGVKVKEFIIRTRNDIFSIIKYFLFNPGRLKRFFKIFFYLKSYPLKKRLIYSIRYADCINTKANLIHFQWLTHLAELYWLPQILNLPTFVSVRGSMVTISKYKSLYNNQLVQDALNKADRIHFVSKSLLDFTCKTYNVENKKTFVNYNGINIEQFKSCSFNFERKTNIVLISVGALIWRKNFQDLLKIIAQSKYRKMIELRIIGSGEEKFILDFISNKYNLNNNVFLIGKLDEEQVLEQLNQADIYLSTSYAEGLSNSVVEAAACGLPVIAFDCEGMSEVIISDKTGIIVPHGRVDLFANELDKLIENPEVRYNMGREARNHIVTNFIENDQINAMIKEYQIIVKKK